MNDMKKEIKKNLLHKLMAEMDRQDGKPHSPDNPRGQGHGDPVAVMQEARKEMPKSNAPEATPMEKSEDSERGWGKNFVSKKKMRQMRDMR